MSTNIENLLKILTWQKNKNDLNSPCIAQGFCQNFMYKKLSQHYFIDKNDFYKLMKEIWIQILYIDLQILVTLDKFNQKIL